MRELSSAEYKDFFNIEDKEIVKEAYDRAWKARNLEIDKYWIRTGYFWGLNALILGGLFISIKEINNNFSNFLIILSLFSVGIIFSLGWFLSNKGSKFWQANWEAHIERLEDYISVPLYKINFSRTKTVYSVSRINEVLSLFVLMTHILGFCSLFIWILKKTNLYFFIGYFTAFLIIIFFVYLLLQTSKNYPKAHKFYKRAQ